MDPSIYPSPRGDFLYCLQHQLPKLLFLTPTNHIQRVPSLDSISFLGWGGVGGMCGLEDINDPKFYHLSLLSVLVQAGGSYSPEMSGGGSGPPIVLTHTERIGVLQREGRKATVEFYLLGGFQSQQHLIPYQTCG